LIDFSSLALPLLRLLPPERAHQATIAALRLGFGPRSSRGDDPILAQRLWGLDFPNPIGLAAGFDKNGEAMDAMLDIGFGFVEVGTVTPRPQSGNPKPRLFRLADDQAVINRLGFNSQGSAAVRARLARRWQAGNRRGVVGINVGRNRDSDDAALDYAEGLKALGGFADYAVMNISSPNTPGLRDLQERAHMADLIARVRAAREELESSGARAGGAPLPLLFKIAPDLSLAQLEGIAAAALEGRIDGLIVSNTTITRPHGLKSPDRDEVGGLSGAPLFALSTEILRIMFGLTAGKIPLIGVGGIQTGQDVYTKIRAGASLVQLYTALIYRGPGLVAALKAELAGCLRRDGFASVAAAVGADSH
jgi:dihydroorotate dehydrogenase